MIHAALTDLHSGLFHFKWRHPFWVLCESTLLGLWYLDVLGMGENPYGWVPAMAVKAMHLHVSSVPTNISLSVKRIFGLDFVLHQGTYRKIHYGITSSSIGKHYSAIYWETVFWVSLVHNFIHVTDSRLNVSHLST